MRTVRHLELIKMDDDRIENAFWFPRMRGAPIGSGAQAGTYPEDHEKVCVRTEVPPSGKKRPTVARPEQDTSG